MSGPSVRITHASYEADLAAVVWPGLSGVCCPSIESAGQVQQIDELVGRFERLRGIRPGTVAIQPFIESARGVTSAYEIASSSQRIHAFGAGPKLYLHLDVESGPEGAALLYARSECELAARAVGLDPVTTEYLAD